MDGFEDLVRPHWIPPDLDFNALPEQLQLYFQTAIEPGYREQVLGGRDPLEREAWDILLQELWIKVMAQNALAKKLAAACQSGRPFDFEAKELKQYDRRVVKTHNAVKMLKTARTMASELAPLHGEGTGDHGRP